MIEMQIVSNSENNKFWRRITVGAQMQGDYAAARTGGVSTIWQIQRNWRWWLKAKDSRSCEKSKHDGVHAQATRRNWENDQII
ncbi:unnamed protein product [Blepharisma stoltei]|uniref:Uncharacterized protein n=1 Tax=Blepharisma stoltei TaxID=1481888 RepID=A0AAU9JYU4_9CILI|nr:unnamed protein product [Blepharisma stoltei]